MISSYSCYKAILWHKGLGWWPFRNEYVPAGIYAGEPILLNMIHRQLYHDFAEWINHMTHKPLHTRMYFGARRSCELCQANVFPTDVNLRVTNDQITGRMYSRVFLCIYPLGVQNFLHTEIGKGLEMQQEWWRIFDFTVIVKTM